MEQGPTTVRQELGDWTIEKFKGHNIIFFKGKNYIHKDNGLQCNITKMFHDHETAGHHRELETHNTIQQHYWWPGLCIGCDTGVGHTATCNHSVMGFRQVTSLILILIFSYFFSFFCLSDICHTTTICHTLIGVLPLSTTTTSLTTTTKRTITKTNQDGNEGWEMRAGA